MLPNQPTFVGVDFSGSRASCVWAALNQHGQVLALAEGEMNDCLSFLGGLPQACVALNAPPRPNQGVVRQRHLTLPGLGRSLEMRLAEYELRQRGLAVGATPSRREFCPGWMQAGFEFYRLLAEFGYQMELPEKAERRMLETHPQACFAFLSGGTLFSRSSLEGRLQRQLILFEAGLRLRDPMDFFEELTRHKLLKGSLPLQQLYTSEQLDALAAAWVAWRAVCRSEEVFVLGDPLEGQLTLPKPTREVTGRN